MVLLAFIIYITVNGELSIYMGFFSPATSSGTGSGTTATPAPTLSTGVTPSQNLPGVPNVNNNPLSTQGLPSGMTTGNNPFLGGGPSWFNNLVNPGGNQPSVGKTPSPDQSPGIVEKYQAPSWMGF